MPFEAFELFFYFFFWDLDLKLLSFLLVFVGLDMVGYVSDDVLVQLSRCCLSNNAFDVLSNVNTWSLK